MTRQASVNKSVALEELYSRITRIADELSGTASRTSPRHFLPSAVVAEPVSEAVPALRVEMPDSFQVDFAPSYPLGTPGNALSVEARRTHHGARKSDWRFNFGAAGWQRTQTALTDDEIRACLTPEGPPPAIW
jgi:hypothetical protein